MSKKGVGRRLFSSMIPQQAKLAGELDPGVKACQAAEYNCWLETKKIEWHFFS